MPARHQGVELEFVNVAACASPSTAAGPSDMLPSVEPAALRATTMAEVRAALSGLVRQQTALGERMAALERSGTLTGVMRLTAALSAATLERAASAGLATTPTSPSESASSPLFRGHVDHGDPAESDREGAAFSACCTGAVAPQLRPERGTGPRLDRARASARSLQVAVGARGALNGSDVFLDESPRQLGASAPFLAAPRAPSIARGRPAAGTDPDRHVTPSHSTPSSGADEEALWPGLTDDQALRCLKRTICILGISFSPKWRRTTLLVLVRTRTYMFLYTNDICAF